jgi:hypothetical protein
MRTIIFFLFLFLPFELLFAKTAKPLQEISINGFRNPSIGMEFRRDNFSVQAGFYITALKAGQTWKFSKTGFCLWLQPFSHNR